MGAQGAELVKLRTEYEALAKSGGMIAAADKLAQITELLAKGSPEAQAHALAIGKLRAEYDALVANGNIDAARAKLLEIGRALMGQKSAADVAWEAIRKLEAEYAALNASGNTTGANKKMEEISAALRAMEPAAGVAVKALGDVSKATDAAAEAAKKLKKEQEDAAAQVAAAFGRLNVTSSAELATMAANAQRDYETIKNAGTSTADDISAAFKVAADKAIAANRGIAPSWVEAQAAARGFALEVDAAGKTTVKSMKEADAATKAVGVAAKSTADNYKLLGEHAEQASAQVRKLAEAGQMLAAAEQLRQDIRNKELEASKFMNRGSMNPVDAVPTFNSREEADAWLAETKKQYQRDNPFTTKSSGALGNAGMDLTMAEWRAEVDALAKRDAMKNAGAGPGRNTSTTQSPNAGTSTTTVNITVEGTTRSINTDAQGAATLQELVRQLAQAKSTAAR